MGSQIGFCLAESLCGKNIGGTCASSVLCSIGFMDLKNKTTLFQMLKMLGVPTSLMAWLYWIAADSVCVSMTGTGVLPVAIWQESTLGKSWRCSDSNVEAADFLCLSFCSVRKTEPGCLRIFLVAFLNFILFSSNRTLYRNSNLINTESQNRWGWETPPSP